eukprot:168189_1
MMVESSFDHERNVRDISYLLLVYTSLVSLVQSSLYGLTLHVNTNKLIADKKLKWSISGIVTDIASFCNNAATKWGAFYVLMYLFIAIHAIHMIFVLLGKLSAHEHARKRRRRSVDDPEPELNEEQEHADNEEQEPAENEEQKHAENEEQ